LISGKLVLGESFNLAKLSGHEWPQDAHVTHTPGKPMNLRLAIVGGVNFGSRSAILYLFG
jgi:hypothetical protein